MIILHAGVVEGQLIVWGEAQSPPTLSPSQKKTLKGKSIAVAAFPYDAGWERLQNALAESGVDFFKKKTFAEMIAWLPTINGTPVSSRPLIADPPEADEKITFAPWSITGLPLSSKHALEFLGATMGKETLAPGIIVGKDLEFWAVAVRLAGSLVAKQQFLPGLIANERTFTARWHPVLSEDDRCLRTRAGPE